MSSRFCWFVALPLLIFAQIDSDGDVQFWEWNFIRVKITDTWSYLNTTEFRWGDDVSKFYYTYMQNQIVYAPTKWFSIAPGYRQAARRFPLNTAKWIPEYIPVVDATFTAKPNGWEISNRNRLEYIISKASVYPWLYRNRFRIYLPCEWTSIRIRPFFGEELFWRQGRGIAEERVSLGLKETYSKNFSTEIFYMARFLKAIPHWTYQTVLNVSLFFSF